jgi:hypothetical protein
MTDHRQELIEARAACRNFVITKKTGAIRVRPRGPQVGVVDRESGEWAAYARGEVARGSTRREAAAGALHRYANRVAEAFLVDLIERHSGRLDDIRLAIANSWRDDPNALGELCSEDDLKKALRAVEINRSIREAAA